MRIRTAASGVVIAACLATTTQLGLVDGAPLGETSCAMADPYGLTAQQVQDCGFHSFPLESVTTLGDGGKEYRYHVEGNLVIVRRPPRGFDPTIAPAEKLAFYGLPAKPTTKPELDKWLAMMRHIDFVVPPPALIETTTQATTFNNWSGYWATNYCHDSTGSTSCLSAQGDWVEPAWTNSACSTNAGVTWVGLGSSRTGLAQNGVAIHENPNGGLNDYQGWWEILPASAVPINVYLKPGYYFEAITGWQARSGDFNFYWYDSYSGKSLSVLEPSSSYDGSSAEFIVERPTVGGVLQNLTNFQNVTFSDTYVNGTGPSHTLPNYTYSPIAMYNSADNHYLATVGPLLSSNGGFIDTFQNCI